MASLWTQITNVASRVCDPTRSDSAVNDEIMHLQAVLDETRLRLHHEQRVSQELQAQMGDERRRGEMRQREMHEKLEMQDEEIRQLQAHLETAMHQKKEAFDRPPDNVADVPQKKAVTDASNARMCEAELLAALLEHATKQATASAAVVTAESTALQQLRSELEAAQGKASEEQEAAKELRQQLQNEKASRLKVEQLLELQRKSLLREFHRRKTFEAKVAEFLQLLGQRYPGLACNVHPMTA